MLEAPAEVLEAVDVGVAPQPAVGEPTEALLGSLPTGSLGMQVFLLALPMLGEQLVNYMVGMVDTYLAGGVSKEATVAVGTGSYVGWFLTMAFTLVGVGASAFISRKFGQRDISTASRALNQALLISAIIGLAVTATILLAAPLFALLLTQTPEAHALCIRYLRIDALGHLGAAVSFGGFAVMRAAGDTRTPMVVMIVVNLVNVVVSAGLVYGWFGPALGVTGIVLGTVVARYSGCVLALLVLARGLRGMRLRAAELLRPDWSVIQPILRIGVPAAAEAAILWSAQLVFITIVSHTAEGAQSTINFAAHLIAMRVEGFTYLPAMAWMTAAATLVGQYLGARRPERASRAGHLAALQGGGMIVGVSLFYFFGAGFIYNMMTDDLHVRAVGVPAFRILAFVQPFLAMGIIYVGALRGAGDTRATMRITAISNLLARLPTALVFGILLNGGLIGAWCGMWADNVLRFVLVARRYAQGAWKRIEV